MPLVDVVLIDLAALVDSRDIECECMLCHLPRGQKHGPVQWKLTWRFPGPYPKPGTATMLMCNLCYLDWLNHPDEFGGFPDSSHKI